LPFCRFWRDGICSIWRTADSILAISHAGSLSILPRQSRQSAGSFNAGLMVLAGATTIGSLAMLPLVRRF
jgi:hypothetical protein